MDACFPNKDLRARRIGRKEAMLFCGNAQHLLVAACLGCRQPCLFSNDAYVPCSSVESSVAAMSCGCVSVFLVMFSSALLMSFVFACRACDSHTSVFYMSRCGWVGGHPTIFVCQLFPPNLRCFPPLGLMDACVFRMSHAWRDASFLDAMYL